MEFSIGQVLKSLYLLYLTLLLLKDVCSADMGFPSSIYQAVAWLTQPSTRKVLPAMLEGYAVLCGQEYVPNNVIS